MPHCTSSRGHLVGEPPHPNKRTTIGLCSDDYWYGGQTTISLHTKPIVLREQTTTASPLPALLLHPRERPILVGGLTYIGSHHPLTEEGQTALYNTAIYPQQERQRDHLQRARQTALRHPPKWAERCFFSIIF